MTAGAGGPEPLCGGVDLGGTKLSAALFTRSGDISARMKAALDKSAPERPAERILEAVRRLEAEAPRGAAVLGVGVCVPGAVFPEDGSVWAPNIPGWDRFPLSAFLRSRSRLRFVVHDDRAAYVAGESWRGAARGLRDVVFLAVGTGIGAGILAGGRPVSGAHGVAGAAGWLALNPGFRPEFAERGCFESEAAGDSVGRAAREALRTGAGGILAELAGKDPEAATAATVVAAARRGDPEAKRILDRAAAFLAMGVADLVSLLDPEMVVLGGGLVQGAPELLDSVRRDFRRWAQPLAAARVAIELSALGEDAGLYGAARLAWDAAGAGAAAA